MGVEISRHRAIRSVGRTIARKRPTRCLDKPGCSAVWLARVVWDHEAVGSNPTTPTIVPVGCTSREMVERAGGRIVGVEFLIELSFLAGRKKLQGYPVRSQIVYADET